MTEILWSGDPCPQCGDPLREAITHIDEYLARTTEVWCDRCQWIHEFQYPPTLDMPLTNEVVEGAHKCKK